MRLVDGRRFEVLGTLLQAQLAISPGQETFFRRRINGESETELVKLNELAHHVSKLVDQRVDDYAKDYSWLCEEQVNEELNFRRTGQYRLKTFEEAYREVYGNKPYMTRYMNGLLLTQLWWANHTAVMSYYRDNFLPNNPNGYSHLEIGPGHGLFLYFAATDPRCSSATGWDISEASIALTREALLKLGLERSPNLELVDLFKGPIGAFDSIVFSEVLEHMENPRASLDVLRSLLAPSGRLFINMPINSPAPDHLFNADSPEQLEEFIKQSGLSIVDRAFFPATNQTLENARRKKLTISCVFVATPA
jgi:2-polyprenyl-3-methyl-5-hydroxy-6-metoxy-1,4-benzoquinol methylase